MKSLVEITCDYQMNQNNTGAYYIGRWWVDISAWPCGVMEIVSQVLISSVAVMVLHTFPSANKKAENQRANNCSTISARPMSGSQQILFMSWSGDDLK